MKSMSNPTSTTACFSFSGSPVIVRSLRLYGVKVCVNVYNLTYNTYNIMKIIYLILISFILGVTIFLLHDVNKTQGKLEEQRCDDNSENIILNYAAEGCAIESTFYCPRKVISHCGNVVLDVLSIKELRYGEMSWSFRFWVDEKAVENKVINNNQGLFSNLSLVQFTSSDQKYFYIPKIEPLIYEVNSKSFYRFEAAKDDLFIRNIFLENALIIVQRTSLSIIDLVNMKMYRKEYHPDEHFFEDVTLTKEGKILMDYRDLVKQSFEFNTTTIDEFKSSASVSMSVKSKF